MNASAQRGASQAAQTSNLRLLSVPLSTEKQPETEILHLFQGQLLQHVIS
jgi:hypothetical protein